MWARTSQCLHGRLPQIFGLIDRLQKVTLIEPSITALKRAKLHVEQAVGDEVYIEGLNCYLPSVDVSLKDEAIGGLHIEEPICIHLFSNILDIPEIDLKELALLVSSSGYRHYFVCVGPVNFGNDRLSAFPRYFNIQQGNFFIDFKAGQYKQLPSGNGMVVLRRDSKSSGRRVNHSLFPFRIIHLSNFMELSDSMQ